MEKGQIGLLRPCHKKEANAWFRIHGRVVVFVYVNGKSKDLSGTILKLTSNTGETMTLVLKGKNWSQKNKLATLVRQYE